MDFKQQNLANLIGLWHKYGAINVAAGEGAEIFSNISWPHRCWLNLPISQGEGITTSTSEFKAITSQSIVPVWSEPTPTLADEANISLEQWLITHGWHCQFEQSAMYLDLSQYTRDHKYGVAVSGQVSRTELMLTPVVTSDDVKDWVAIGSEAFGYQIDRAVVQHLVTDSTIELLLVNLDGKNIASALCYKTGTVVGLHQIGVATAAQGQGIARWLMQQLIDRAGKSQIKTIVLQASVAGKHLYDSLGFKTQFTIKNYQKNH